MKRARSTEEEIIRVLKEHEAGAKTTDLARKHGISEATIHNWNGQIRQHDVSKTKRLSAPEEENGEAEEAFGRAGARCSRTSRAPFKNSRARRQARSGRASAVRHEPVGTAGLLDCGGRQKMIRYCSGRPPEAVLRGRLRDLANERRFGYRRLFVLLRREGGIYWALSRGRAHRPQAAGSPQGRGPVVIEAKPNARWTSSTTSSPMATLPHPQHRRGRHQVELPPSDRTLGWFE
ncbi:transposase-like protein [Bradyrhizobium sp. USDA 4472]